MKLMKLLSMAALGLTASTAIAQSHPSAPGIASATVSGLFIPIRSGEVASFTFRITAPPSALVTPTSPTGVAVRGVLAGTPASIAPFTEALTAVGIPPSAAQGIVTALQQLGSAPTVGSVLTAAATWNAAIESLNTTQLTALLTTEQGVSALRAMYHAYNGASRAR